MITIQVLEIPLYKIPVQEINLTQVTFDWNNITPKKFSRLANTHSWLWKFKLIKDIDLN